MNHYDNGFVDGKDDIGARYPTTSRKDFENYQRGFIDGFFERMKRDAEKFTPLYTYTVCLHQRVIARAHRYVNVLATSEGEAMRLAEEGEQIQRVSKAYLDETEELLSEEAEVICPDDSAWQNELKDWA